MVFSVDLRPPTKIFDYILVLVERVAICAIVAIVGADRRKPVCCAIGKIIVCNAYKSQLSV